MASKAYSPFTLDKFGGLRFGDSANSAAMEDNEAVQIDNFNFTDMGTLKKRDGWYPTNTDVTMTLKIPAGAPTAHPATIYPLGVQRLSPAGAVHRLWFTNMAQTDIWFLLFPSLATADCTLARVPAGVAIDKAEWIIQAATPTAPYQMHLCRSGGNGSGGLISIDQTGTPTAFLTSPAGTHLSLFKDRLFMVNSIHAGGQESRVYFSDSAIPPGLGYGTWPANNFFDIAPASGEFNVATIVFNDQLMIFKNRSIWTLTVEGLPSNWLVRNLHPSIGCIGRGTVKIINGFIYFLSLEGVYRTDGTTFERLSDPVDDMLRQFQTLTANDVLRRNALHWDDKYILLMPDANADVLSAQVYNLNVQQWSRWVWGTTPPLNIPNAVTYWETTPPSLYAGDADDNCVYNMGDNVYYQDNGSNFSAIWRSKKFTWGDPTVYKRNYWVGIDVGFTGGVRSLSFTHIGDTNDTATFFQETIVNPSDNTTYDFVRKELKFRGFGYSRALSGQITYLTDTALEIFNITWLNNVKDTVGKPN